MNNWFGILNLEETVQKVIICHPQLDWRSNNSLCAIQLRDSLFQGNDTKECFEQPQYMKFVICNIKSSVSLKI
jgi:hypothetical protein